MKLIEHNPFRMLGIPVNASSLELEESLDDLQGLAVGQQVSFPLDLPLLLTPIKRTQTDVERAKKCFDLPQDKILNALFWFAKPLDAQEKQFYEKMLQGYVDTAIDDFRRCSSWQSRLNLATLHLIKGNMQGALSAMSALIDYHCEEFVRAVAGQTYSEESAHLRHRYIETLGAEVKAADLYAQLANTEVPTSMLEELRGLAVDEPTAIIEKEIATARAVDNNNAEAQLEAGKRLSNNTHKARIQLQKMIGDNDPRYSRLVDKLANQILQCSINYFNKIDGENRTIIENALKLGEYALKIAVGKMARDHIQHNVDILRKKKENLPPAEIEEHDTAIKAKIVENILLKGQTIDSAIQLMKDCAPHIVDIKEHTSLRPYYLNISTQVVNAALSSVIEEYNKVSEQLSSKLQTQLYRDSAITTLKNLLKKAWKATLMMDMFDKEDGFKNGRYAENRKALKEMYENVFGSYSAPSRIGYDELDLRTEEEIFLLCKTSADYRNYISRFPNGRHLNEARQKQQVLFAKEEEQRKIREQQERERKQRKEKQRKEREERERREREEAERKELTWQIVKWGSIIGGFIICAASGTGWGILIGGIGYFIAKVNLD